MEFAIAVFTGLIFLTITDFLSPAKPPKTPEEEMGEAITKYLAATKKDGEKKGGGK